MKRIKLLVFNFLLCLISINIVNAKSANIIIETLELDSKSEGATIVSEPTFSGFNIESNISFQELNDYVKYKITLKNEDNEDYTITLINDNNQSEYFEYSYEYDEELKKNSTSIVYLTIKYKEEKTIGYQENSNVELSVTLKDSEGNIVVPQTLDDIDFYIIIGVISILALLITFILLKKNKKKKVLLVLLLLMPLITYAGSKVSLKITINSKIEVIQKEVRCTTDETLEKGLTYTNGQYTYVYMMEADNTTELNHEGWSVQLTDKESTNPVTSNVCTYINDKPITSMKLMFSESKTTSIDLSSFNTKNVTNMNSMFKNCSSIEELDLSTFNMSSVNNINDMLNGMSSLTTINTPSEMGDAIIILPKEMVDNEDNEYTTITNETPTGTSIEIPRTANLLSGQTVNTKLKSLAGNTSPTINTQDENIIHIERSEEEPSEENKTSEHIISTADSNYPVYAWFNNGIIYYYSKAQTIYLNSISSYLFVYLTKLESLDLSDFDTSKVTSMTGMFSTCRSLTSLDLGDKFDTSKVTNMSWVFGNCSSLTSIDLGDKFDTSNVTNMFCMFNNCNKLTSIDLGEKFDTSKVTNMQSMFQSCSSLTGLDLGDNFYTSGVTTMETMFQSCSSLTSLDLGDNFDTSSVTNMFFMFNGCSSLASLDLGGNFDTSKVTTMFGMFQSCSSLTSLDLGDNFDTSKVTEMNQMFKGCSNLTTIYVSELWDTSNVTSYISIFNGCNNLVGGSGTHYTSSMSSDINYARVDKAIYDSENNIWVEDTTKPGLLSIKQSINPSESIAQFDTGSNINTMLKSLPNLVSIERSSTAPSSSSDASNISVGSVPIYAWFENETMKYYSEEQTIYLNEDSSNMFNGLNKLEDIDLKSVDTSKVENMDNMFKDCNSINSLNLGTFDMSSTNSNNNMISSMTSLKSVKTPMDVGNNSIVLPSQFEENRIDNQTQVQSWIEVSKMSQLIKGNELNTKLKILAGNISATANTEDYNITSIQRSDDISSTYMTQNNIISNDYYAYPVYAWFEEGTIYYYSEAETIFMNKDSSSSFILMKNLVDIDLSSFDTSKVRSMAGMFYNCSSIEQIDLSSFNTSNVIDMEAMFMECSSLFILDLTSFDTHNLVITYNMFNNCRNIRMIDLSSFDNSSLERIAFMFYNCNLLERIFVGNSWKIYGQYSSNQTNQMLYNCNSLVGQYGTIYTSDVNGNEVNYIHPDKMVYDVNNEMWINDNSNPGLFTLKSN